MCWAQTPPRAACGWKPAGRGRPIPSWELAMPLEGSAARRLGLVEAVDHLLNRGVVLTENASISLAGVELVYLGLNLYLSSTETLRRGGVVRNTRTPLPDGSPAAPMAAALAPDGAAAP